MRQETGIDTGRETWLRSRQWRIHLGAHKTATTHVQETLAADPADLVARGVDFIPTTRCARAAASPRRSGAAAADRPAAARRAGAMRDAIEATRRAAPGRPRRRGLLRGEDPRRARSTSSRALLPAGGQRIGRLASLGARAELTALPVDPQLRHAAALGLCRGAEACAAAAGRLRGDPGAGARRPPSWFDLVARIRAAAPGRAAPDLAAGGLPRPRPGDHGGALRLARSGRCPRSPTRPGPARPRRRRSRPPRRCPRALRTPSGWRGCARSYAAVEPGGGPLPALRRGASGSGCRPPMRRSRAHRPARPRRADALLNPGSSRPERPSARISRLPCARASRLAERRTSCRDESSTLRFGR